jgi:hypothetical protein
LLICLEGKHGVLLAGEMNKAESLFVKNVMVQRDWKLYESLIEV